ncbi:MAG: hypothetical protein ACI9R3_005030 [Verrucomicrobiales bacterium]|jgi:hypothetical protein
MYLVVLGDLLDRRDSPDGLHGHSAFEFGLVSFPFSFHFGVSLVCLHSPHPTTTIIAWLLV